MPDNNGTIGADAVRPTKRPLRVIFLSISYHPEPGAQHGLPLARWIADQGHEVKVLTCFPQYPLGRIYDGYRQRWRQWENVEGIPTLRVPIYPSHDTNALRRMVTYFSFMFTATLIGVPSIGSADVVFLYDPPPTTGIASLALKLFRGMPIVHHIGDIWPETVLESGMLNNERIKGIVERIIGSYCRFLYRQADSVSVLSPGFKQMLIERGVPEEKIEVVYNWADEAMFAPQERDEELAEKYGFTGRFNVVYSGNMGPLQNIETVVQTAALLQDYPEIQIVIIGTGPKEAEVKQMAADLNVRNVRFIERRPYTEMVRFNSISDVMLAHLQDKPFLHSTIPSKTQVAMCCGRPLVIGVKGDAADLVLRAGAGVACEPENPESMAEAILQLYRMPAAEREAMGRRGREHYEQHLCLNASAGKMERLFLRAAAHKGDVKRPAQILTQIIKRGFDIAFAMSALILLAPFMLLVALWVRLDSAGPILYRGRRTGRYGKPFHIYKFRTMRPNSESLGSTTALNDPRITRSGRFLRKYKLDELPQFLNVLKGEMSIVGPRPEVEEHTADYTQEEQAILSVRPGITDYASIRFADLASIVGEEDPHNVYVTRVRGEKNRLRLEYVRRMSLWVDAQIILMTVWAILRKALPSRLKGAELWKLPVSE
jgi:lipopolysaccharide/colanic/teichoic acid biosynthesis glycosyltransferase/glycosyltransferase involved in cell wall biosynthesis